MFTIYESEYEKNNDILFRKFDLDIERLKLEYMMLAVDGDLFTEDNNEVDLSFNNKSKSKEKSDDKGTKKKNIIIRLCESIIKFITDVVSSVKDIFTPGKSHVDIKSYLASEQGQIELDNDLMKVEDQVNEEIRKGRKIVQAIANKTKIDDAVVEEYIDNAAKGVKNYGRTIVGTGYSYLLYQKSTGRLKAMKDELAATAKLAKDTITDPDADVQVYPVIQAMKKWIKEGAAIYSLFGREIDQEARRIEASKAGNNK